MDDLLEAADTTFESTEDTWQQLNVEQLLLDLSAPEVNRRMIAARAFSEIRERRAVHDLVCLLQDRCPLVRVSAAYALGRNPCAQAVEPLIDALRQDWNGYVRKGVVWALGNCCDNRAFGPLVEALITDIPAVRLWAASALGQLGDPLAFNALVEALRRDELAVVRSNCAWALGKLEDMRAVPYLIEALEDVDLGVRQDAREALDMLGYRQEEIFDAGDTLL